jgi:dTDP-4-dehydrorhamnose reductase
MSQPSSKKRLLITGATGMLGGTLAKLFQQDFEVYATGTSTIDSGTFDNYKAFDLGASSFEPLITWAQPHAIIQCAALTNGNYCAKNDLEAYKINGLASKKLVEAAGPEVKIIYISTDAVFASDTHLAKETSCVCPESVYGKSKELGEFYLQHFHENFVIIRTTIVGLNIFSDKKGFAEWIIDSAREGQEISLFDDVVFTPITTWHLGEQLQFIMNNEPLFKNQILHVSGKEICTKYKFGIRLLEGLNLPTTMVKKGFITSFADRAKRSTDQTLDCSLYTEISGQELPDLDQTIAAFIKNHTN